jgi:predicted enzyme related to lactoylglutathione lyase
LLSQFPIDVVLLATDLEASKDFYANKVGLQVLMEFPGGVMFKCGGDSSLFIRESKVGTADDQTQASFRVMDLKAEAEELRSRGVKIEDYDLPELKTVDGIANMGMAWMAWFIDPGKNCIALLQPK